MRASNINKPLHGQRTDYNDVFHCYRDPIKLFAKVISANPLAAIILSVVPFLAVTIGGIVLYLATRQLSAQKQQLAAIIGLIIAVVLALVICRLWLASIFLIKNVQNKNKLKLGGLIKYSHEFTSTFFALLFVHAAVLMLFGWLLLNATVDYKTSFQLFLFITLSGLFAGLTFAKLLLAYYLIVYEDLNLWQSVKRSFDLSRRNNVAILSALIAGATTYGIGAFSLVGNSSSASEVYNRIVADNDKKTSLKNHPLNWLIVLLALILLLGGGLITRHSLMKHDETIRTTTKSQQTENYCYFNSNSSTYECKNSRQECLKEVLCQRSLEAKDDINDLLETNLD